MDAEEIRLLQIEGQIHALARAWLYLAAHMEMQGLLAPGSLDRSMLATHWQGAPFEPHAHKAMQYLLDQLADARESRERRDRYRATGLDE